jgi:hypothetical protein
MLEKAGTYFVRKNRQVVVLKYLQSLDDLFSENSMLLIDRGGYSFELVPENRVVI